MPEILDAHARPPAALREVYKHYQRKDVNLLDGDSNLLQLDQLSSPRETARLSSSNTVELPDDLRTIFAEFIGLELDDTPVDDARPGIFEIADLPGLFIYPSLLPQRVQVELLERLLHRDLACPQHLTNIHLHYDVPYPVCSSLSEGSESASYFDISSQSLDFEPKDPTVHKPFSTQQFLNKKLRWMTLGGQYDWTKKAYPAEQPPSFPQDIKRLVEDIFPMRAEAAIVNLYSPGDTLSLHRDVSEECNRPLASISLGCDAIFIAGLNTTDSNSDARMIAVRLRSGDALVMSGESRYAWHGVPKVLKGTCPEWMRDWPAKEHTGTEQREYWKGWMEGKRINVNVRQMFA